MRIFKYIWLMVGILIIGCQPTTASTTPTTSVLSPSNNSLAAQGTTVLQPRTNQQQQATPVPSPTPVLLTNVNFGESIEVDTAGGAVQVTFTLEDITIVDIIAQSVDGTTDPVIYFYNDKDRLLSYSDNFTARRTDLNDVDSMIENAFLTAGTYSVRVESGGGDGKVALRVQEGTGGVLGLGQITVINGELGAGQRYQQHLNLNAKELVSITVISKSETLDPRINLRNSKGVRLAKNDDTDSIDILLDVTDAKIERFIATESDDYIVEIRGFNLTDTGTFQMIIQRYGTLEPVAEAPQILSGNILSRGRLSFPLELEAGEVISVTAQAANSLVDPQVTILDPDNVIVMSNDDHGTNNPDLPQYDAQFTNYITQMNGTYTLDLESVSGRGGYKVTIERLGKINPENIGAPIDASAFEIMLPTTPESNEGVVPENTAEASPTSS